MNLAKHIDHTLLKPDATQVQIKRLCDEARTHGFASVCINPVWVRFATEQLQGSGVKVCTVIGFPLGATTPQVKAFEAQEAVKNGADELDMVLNIGALKAGDTNTVLHDIRAVRSATADKTLKVIIETALLSDEEKVIACQLATQAGADFVKTSTGFNGDGATTSDVALMRQHVPTHMHVKAAGGIRTRTDAEKMIAAGAERIGTSSGVKIIEGK